jgi:hypothetical protein
MGRLRLEPKFKPPVCGKEFDELREMLERAHATAETHHVSYELDDGEKPSRSRKALKYVARQIGMDLSVRHRRSERILELDFGNSRASSARKRLSPAEARKRILFTLGAAKAPLSNSEIIGRSEISPSTSTLRLGELIESGLVERHGAARQTAYSLVQS